MSNQPIKTAEAISQIAKEVEQEYQMSGLTGGLYENFARDVATRFTAELQRENAELRNALEKIANIRELAGDHILSAILLGVKTIAQQALKDK